VARSVFCVGDFLGSLMPDGVLAAGRIEAHLQKGPRHTKMSFWLAEEKYTCATHRENVKHAEMNRTVLEEFSGVVASAVKGSAESVSKNTPPRPFSLRVNNIAKNTATKLYKVSRVSWILCLLIEKKRTIQRKRENHQQ